MIFEVFVEAAKGGRIDDQSHSVAIGRRFPSGARYPADYGFMPWTLARSSWETARSFELGAVMHRLATT